MEISVRSNFKALEKSLNTLANKQLPFATARAVTVMAKRVRDEERSALSSVFDRPTPFTTNSVGSTSANKSSLTATVYVRDIAVAYLEPYEFGGNNKLNSRALLKPIHAKTNQYGNLPKTLLKRLKGNPNVFIGPVKLKNGDVINGVWERSKTPRGQRRLGGYGTKGKMNKMGNTKTSLKLLIKFDDAHEAKQRWGYHDRAKRVVDREYNKIMGRELARAIATTK